MESLCVTVPCFAGDHRIVVGGEGMGVDGRKDRARR